MPSLGSFATRQEAIDALNTQFVDVAETTVADFVEQFIRLRATRWEARTLSNYRWYADRKILPSLGHLALHQLDQRVINEWWINLSEATGTLRNGERSSGRATTTKVWKFLRQILKAADVEGLILHPIGPPVEGASKESNPERVLVTDRNVQTIIDNLPANRRIVAILAAYCALRWGEILGLRRQHIDAAAGVLYVQTVIEEDPTTAHRAEKAPKTEASRRPVPVDPTVMAVIQQHLEAHVPDTSPTAPLVVTSNNTAVGRSTWGQQWRRAIRRAGLDGLRPAITLHDLRHYCLTNASGQTNQIRDVMQYAGHTTTSAAMRYQHRANQDLRHLARPYNPGPQPTHE